VLVKAMGCCTFAELSTVAGPSPRDVLRSSNQLLFINVYCRPSSCLFDATICVLCTGACAVGRLPGLSGALWTLPSDTLQPIPMMHARKQGTNGRRALSRTNKLRQDWLPGEAYTHFRT
jgi:hypothetical protein